MNRRDFIVLVGSGSLIYVPAAALAQLPAEPCPTSARPCFPDGEIIEIDSRPSDAIAVAVTCNPQLPIFVAEDVLNEVLE